MRVKRFEDLAVWQKARDLSVLVYRSSSEGPFTRDWGLRDQIRRAAVSTMSNIAEGFGRYSRAELRQFLSIARGSATEVQSQLYLALELQHISESEHRMLNERCVEVSRMIAALRASIDRA
ncbi:MAG TPA: four helix bundle protein [Longimicrobium sp.]|uniref:four helix bundle protein n=1 Tax=Longimicrobium sp. TaxID=2029185 RepID=UPI002ED7CAB5